ncbi:MAG: ATPase, T2SS/T4P/T4SS family, partial [Patescibacteria group bacterium]
MTTSEKTAFDVMVETGIVQKEAVISAQKSADVSKKTVYEVLLEQEKISDKNVGDALSIKFDAPFADLAQETIEEGVFHIIPQVVAASRGIVAFGHEDDSIRVGMIDPRDIEMRHFLEKRLGAPIIPHVITIVGLAKALAQYKGSLAEAFKALNQRIKDPSLSREARDGATVELVDTIVRYGYKSRASDIHVEPFSRRILVRFRIDGVMHDVLEMPKELADLIVTRIKILS